MLLASEPFKQALARVDELLKSGQQLELICCGGGAISLLGISSRHTRDIDVISPHLPAEFKSAAAQVATEQKLPETWINNGPESLARDLKQGWEERCTEIYRGKNFKLLILGRSDLIATKLFTHSDRDGTPYWPPRVNERFLKLKRTLGYE